MNQSNKFIADSEIIRLFGLVPLFKKLGLNAGDGYHLVDKFIGIKEDEIFGLTPKQYILIGDDAFPYEGADYSHEQATRVALKALQVIDNLLVKGGYLIIINGGYNSIEDYKEECMNVNYRYFDSREDMEENDYLEEEKYVDIIERYGSFYKYYIFQKMNETPFVEVEFPVWESSVNF